MGKRNKSRSRNTTDVSSQQLRFYDSLAFASPGEAALQEEFDFAPSAEPNDRRQFHPDRRSLRSRVEFVPVPVKRPINRRASSQSSSEVRLWSREPGSFQGVFQRERVAFSQKVCSDRSTRREVMFAKKKAGKGGQRKQRTDWKRKVRC